MKKTFLILASLALILVLIAAAMFSVFGVQEDPVLFLDSTNGVLSGNAEVWGNKIGNLGKCGGEIEGTVAFEDLEVPKDGIYTLMVYYASGSDDRYFEITTDSQYYRLDCPNTGSFDDVGVISIDVELKNGDTLVFGSVWYAPDLYQIEVYDPADLIFKDKQYYNQDYFEFEKCIEIDLNNGVYNFLNNGTIVINNAHSEVKVGDDIISSDGFKMHDYRVDTDDKNRKRLNFIHTEHPRFSGEMVQSFTIDTDYVLLTVTLTVYDGEISTNYFSVLSTYKNSLIMDDCMFLQMPYDNDKWVEPKFIAIDDLDRITNGYEVGAFISEDNNGFILGSVSHDVWKTGIKVQADEGEVMGIDLFGGAADSNTRDKNAHGNVVDSTVTSPVMFLGIYDDWREGLTGYGKANCQITPKKESADKVPFGFNSWGSLQSGVKYSDMTAVSNFIKENFNELWSEDDGAIYVNIDSFWDYITKNDSSCNMKLDEALEAFVSICRQNGQKAGIYYTPFACWHSNEEELNSIMDGSSYTYYEAALKNDDGSLYGKLDGGFALDPTHPGTLARIEDRMNYFIDLGFEYIKLDFLTHGALEGFHYDRNITTGTQAYNVGMKKIHEICNGKMFVNLSIAPVFPYQYADGRRISCDAFASLDNTQHVLSYLTACFWHKEIYSYPDPDHLVVTGVSEGEARCRVTSGVISGTSFLIGDNLAAIKKGTGDYNRVIEMFGNKGIIEIAKLGKAFTPVNVTAGQRCADIYYCTVGNTVYVAVYNFTSKTEKTVIDLSDIIPDLKDGTSAVDLWRNTKLTVKDSSVTCIRPSNDVVMIKINKDVIDTNPDTTGSEINTAAPVTTLIDTEIDNHNATAPILLYIIIYIIIAAVVIVALAVIVVVISRKKNKKI